ncbi:hypothetical protein ACTOXX_34465 [Streptomyces rubiginosohelvolus]|uniref:hypothetical protein n=1 Tax=Streptomyces rubiginosohelvolus TaxID=67362 RepID=UPI003F8DAB95
MNVTRCPAASLATEHFDTETQELLDAIDVELPEFGDTDMDVAFGTPLEMFEAGTLPHERLDGLDITAAVAAIEARENRMLAARDIVATDPTATGSSVSAWSTCSSPTPRSCVSRRRSPPRSPCRSRPSSSRVLMDPAPSPGRRLVRRRMWEPDHRSPCTTAPSQDRRKSSASQEGAGVDGTNKSPGFSTLYCTSQRYALSVRQEAGVTRAA